jgi:hypothetical protein
VLANGPRTGTVRGTAQRKGGYSAEFANCLVKAPEGPETGGVQSNGAERVYERCTPTKSERSMLKPLIPEQRLRKCGQDVNTRLQPPKDCESYINRIDRVPAGYAKMMKIGDSS